MRVFFPVSGYKLAFNYLKAKRHVDAIDVCHKVGHGGRGRGLFCVVALCVCFCVYRSVCVSPGSGCSSKLPPNAKGHPGQSSRRSQILIFELDGASSVTLSVPCALKDVVWYQQDFCFVYFIWYIFKRLFLCKNSVFLSDAELSRKPPGVIYEKV